ncbi:Ig-like domain-containing protein [Arthrobacter tecti]
MAVFTALALTAHPLAGAYAATTSYGVWEAFEGEANAYSGAVSFPVTGMPSAELTSTSRSGAVGVQSGTTVWLSPDTPVGTVYGTSQGQQYVNLRPAADTPTGASVTTYTFDSPTPTSGWAFTLGDIDADAVIITAIGPDGLPLSPEQLGFRETFNYCAVSPRPGTCSGTDGLDVPTWNPVTGELLGHPAGIDTVGAAAWFAPTAPLSSLTFTYRQRSGFPVYQTWFSVRGNTVGGSVGTAENRVADVQVRLLDPAGNEVAATTTAIDGSYGFPDVVAQAGYTVEILPPAGYVPVDGTTRTVDTTTTDVTGVDFTLALNQAPAAVDDTATTTIGTPVTVNVLANDDGVDSAIDSSSTLLLNPVDDTYAPTVTLDGEGTYETTAAGSVSFAPTPEFTGTSRIIYQLRSADGDTATADLVITVNPPNPEPSPTPEPSPVPEPSPSPEPSPEPDPTAPPVPTAEPTSAVIPPMVNLPPPAGTGAESNNDRQLPATGIASQTQLTGAAILIVAGVVLIYLRHIRLPGRHR